MITLTNTTQQEIILLGHLFREDGSGDESYDIPSVQLPQWSSDNDVLLNIINGNIVLANYGESITDVNKAIDILKGVVPTKVESSNYPFSSKILPDGKKLFRRVHGVSQTLTGTTGDILFNVPYNNCKITGIEIMGADLGDKISMYVLDTPTGTISGVPNYMLNQFGFNVQIATGLHGYHSNYDADLIKDMIIKVSYDAVTADRTIYMNIFLHDVV